jgi:2-keto-3-deoxy-L-rhamnonate aldolase RhmA
MDRRACLRAFRERLGKEPLLTGLSCAIPHPAVVEIACRTGHDFVILDTEHTSIDATTQEQLVRAADAHGLVCLVKLPDIDETTVRIALDAGACGVIAPHVKSAEDVRHIVELSCFPPRGRRGLCSAARANDYSSGDIRDLVRLTNEELLIIPILEDAEALDNVEAILDADPRIEIFEIGPVDMALSLGLDLEQSITNPSAELQRVLARIVDALHARGKKVLYPTRFPNTPFGAEDQRAALRAVGADLVYGIDTHVVNYGSRRLAALKGRA